MPSSCRGAPLRAPCTGRQAKPGGRTCLPVGREGRPYYSHHSWVTNHPWSNHFVRSAITLFKVSEVNPNPVPILANSTNFSSLNSGAIMAKIGWMPKM